MFFFIAGVQPKKVNLEDHPRVCPSCGLYQARLKRVDHYLSIFFVPLFRVKKGVNFLECRSCGSLSRESGGVLSGPAQAASSTCPYCGKPVESGYRFCPFCGRQV